MKNPNTLLSIAIFLIFHSTLFLNLEFAEAGKRRVEITDDLDDVIDDEEDDDWKQWGTKKEPEFDPPPTDLENMDIAEIQDVMMKRTMGPVFGFVKLVLGVRRTPEMVTEIAMKWSKILRTAAKEVKFWGVDHSTIMFNMAAGQDIAELKEFIFDQAEAYELKIGDQVFRRPGDPPLEAVIEKLNDEKNKGIGTSQNENNDKPKEEL